MENKRRLRSRSPPKEVKKAESTSKTFEVVEERKESIVVNIVSELAFQG
jgi:hypothetical protein